MAQATLATVDALLKEVYEGQLEDQLNDEVVALKRIERSSEGVTDTVGGKYVDFPIRVSRNTGIGYRAEAEQLPAAGTQGYAAVHIPLKYGYGRGRVTGQVMNLAAKNYQAFANAMDEEMSGLKSDVLKDQNRIVYGDGSGLMATVTADGSNTVTVDNVQYLEVGMQIDIRTISSGAAVVSDRTITAINTTTKVVTYSGADGTAATTDGIYRQGNFASGTKREPNGFGSIVSATGALYNVDPSTQSKWAAIDVNNSGTNRPLSEGLMIETCDKVRVNGGKTSVIFGSLGVRRAYFNLLTQQRRYTDTKEFAGGFQGLAFNYGTEIPMVEDVDHPPNRMYFIDESKFKVYRDKPWHWMDDEGHVLKWVTDFDVWEFLLRQYSELGISQRNANAVVKDIIEG